MAGGGSRSAIEGTGGAIRRAAAYRLFKWQSVASKKNLDLKSLGFLREKVGNQALARENAVRHTAGNLLIPSRPEQKSG
jgi:hypothetical protein